LTSVTIPNSVTSIGEYVFAGCSGLTSVTLPDSVTSIEDWAFSNCDGLTSVILPDSVTSIGNYAFAGCSSLTSVIIGNSVTSIGYSAFASCSNLTSIVVDESNTIYSSQDGVLYNKAKTMLILYPGGKSGGFTIPDSVTSIGDGAFSGCQGLTSVTIPNSVTSIGDGAFANCDGLTSVVIPDSVTSIGGLAFQLCDGLTSVTIGNGVTSIDNFAFGYCTGLTSVVIPNSVTSIGVGAFAWCSELTTAYFNGNAPSMGLNVFYSCSSNFTVCYTAGSTGFTTPEWCLSNCYPAAVCAEPTTTTTILEEVCSVVKVQSTILPLNAGLLPHVRRIVITGENSHWDRSTAVSIEDIPIVIPLRVQPTKIIAFMVIPSTLTGFTPGEKEVGVATGAELCTSRIYIP
jgi:hypothetical protein